MRFVKAAVTLIVAGAILTLCYMALAAIYIVRCSTLPSGTCFF